MSEETASRVFTFFFFKRRRRNRRWNCDWSSDVCSSDLVFVVSLSLFPWQFRHRPTKRLRCKVGNFSDKKFWQIGLWKITIVVSRLFQSLRESNFLALVPSSGLLHYFIPLLQYVYLTLHFKFNCLLDDFKRIQILNFDLYAKIRHWEF